MNIKPKRPKKNIFYYLLKLISTARFELHAMIGKKQVILDKCTKCGLCAMKICPSGAISLTEENIPIFNEKVCTGCFGCVNVCPTLAIEFKSTRMRQPLITYKKYILKS